eukprot:GFYU01030442.1.p1 GENE.GFYU01030442.1~~GFYU01030442.1.p1  ORF type:complete len:360 (-),score=96.69 GFYU01030442.1:18-944(-)
MVTTKAIKPEPGLRWNDYLDSLNRISREHFEELLGVDRWVMVEVENAEDEKIQLYTNGLYHTWTDPARFIQDNDADTIQLWMLTLGGKGSFQRLVGESHNPTEAALTRSGDVFEAWGDNIADLCPSDFMNMEADDRIKAEAAMFAYMIQSRAESNSGKLETLAKAHRCYLGTGSRIQSAGEFTYNLYIMAQTAGAYAWLSRRSQAVAAVRQVFPDDFVPSPADARSDDRRRELTTVFLADAAISTMGNYIDRTDELYTEHSRAPWKDVLLSGAAHVMKHIRVLADVGYMNVQPDADVVSRKYMGYANA